MDGIERNRERYGDFIKNPTESNVIKCEREWNKSDLSETKQIRQIHINEHLRLYTRTMTQWEKSKLGKDFENRWYKHIETIK